MKVSVITVAFNSVSFINDCLASVKLQKYSDIEHIIIDGASTDGTLSILESKRHQFATLISEKDRGIYHAMNKGIGIASGDIIGFLNSDDFYINNSVISEVVKEFKKDSSIDACYADLLYGKDLIPQRLFVMLNPVNLKKVYFPKDGAHHTQLFVRRSVYKDLGNFDINYNIASDVDLMMRFLKVHKIKSIYIPKVWIKMEWAVPQIKV